MGILKLLIILLFLCPLFNTYGIAKKDSRSVSFCGSNNAPIQWISVAASSSRLWLSWIQRPNLQFSLTLPNSGDFLVRNINYLSQQVQLYDPNDCLPSGLLTLNLSSSPFVGSFYRNSEYLSWLSSESLSFSTPGDWLPQQRSSLRDSFIFHGIFKSNECMQCNCGRYAKTWFSVISIQWERFFVWPHLRWSFLVLECPRPQLWWYLWVFYSTYVQKKKKKMRMVRIVVNF